MAEEAVTQDGRQIGISRIYLKDSSFESPQSPAVFNDEWAPHINMNLNTQSNSINEDNYEVVLTVTVEVKNNDKSAFLCEVQQAGLFVIKGLNEAETKHIAGSFCPNQLFPYARAAISDLVSKGGFPNLTLQPLNFDALLQQHYKEVQKAQAEASSEENRH